MRVNMYSVIDMSNERYSIPFGIVSNDIEHTEAIKRFMYMLTVNPEMRIRAADYDIFLAGVFDDETGNYEVDKMFNTIINGAEIVKYLDDSSISTTEILDKIYEERNK